MASQQDLQEILRILTTGKNKLTMLGAMGKVKALQVAGLRSIADIAAADLATVTDAVGDEKTAKQLRAETKKAPESRKRSAPDLSSDSKKKRSQFELAAEPLTPHEYEASLELPAPSVDEEEIAATSLYTNRAPLVLAFVVTLLKYTMPEQPLSSRLSLAQAVVSLNSQSKAVSLGLTSGSAERDGWGQGQPKIKVMGRDVHVLKRTGYKWQAETSSVKAETSLEVKQIPEAHTTDVSPHLKEQHVEVKVEDVDHPNDVHSAGDVTQALQWTVSQTSSLKKSSFVARSIAVTSPAEARAAVHQLMLQKPELRDATHNVEVWRIQGDHGVIENANEDGETGAGSHLLALLRSMNQVNVLLVMSRWYGGVFLHNDRWRLMSEVSRDALSQRLRIAGVVSNEPLWGLDLEAMKSTNAPVAGGTAGGMPIHKPESARDYILKAFLTPPPGDGESPGKKKSGTALSRERQHNLGLLLAALESLFGSWVEHISKDELDRKAWSWYILVRPEVKDGIGGWGGKNVVKLSDILALRRTL